MSSTIPSEPSNAPPGNEDSVASLRQELAAMRLQNEKVERLAQENLNLQQLVRELLEGKARVARAAEGSAPPSGDPSNVFERYLHQGEVTPSPLPRESATLESRNTTVQAPPIESTPLDQGLASSVNRAGSPPRPFSPRQAPSPQYHATPVISPQYARAASVPHMQSFQQVVPDVHSQFLSSSTTADRVKLSDLPKFTGKFGVPADLFHWRSLIEETFEVKNVNDDGERLKLLGSLLNDEAMAAWYQSNKENLRRGSWKEAMDTMAMGTLPHAWLTDTEEAFRSLEMKPQESFNDYVTRAQALHQLIKRSGQVTDRHLAQHITWGAPQLFRDMVDREKLLLVEPFSFPVFKDAADGIWRFLIHSKLLPDPTAKPKIHNTPLAFGYSRSSVPSRARTEEERAENGWRYHEYLRRNGICAVCKEKCNDPRCNKRSARFLLVPSNFDAGPRPSRPSTMPRSNPPGAPTQRPAGRPTNQTPATRVAAFDSFPDVLVEDIAAYEEADRFRQTQVEEVAEGEAGCLASLSVSPVILELMCNGKTIRALIDSGAGANLLSDSMASKLRIPRRPLVSPVEVRLAVATGGEPIVLKEFAMANLKSENPSIRFGAVFFKLAPLGSKYDMILGSPFLSKFKLDVSLHRRCVVHTPSGKVIFEKEMQDELKRLMCAVENLDKISEVDKLGEKEDAMLEEFKDLFPAELPPVEDGEVEETFPEGMPDSSRQVRHKIILTDPNVVINKKQYGYPLKYCESWRKLIDQHLRAGRIRRSQSQYASPSMIIPKKDPTELPRWICDYQTLNKYTVKDRAPLPNVDESVRLVATGKVWSVVDQVNSFFQDRMREEDIPLTAVKTPWGLYEWVVMPMGLTNGPATHQARNEEILGELVGRICVVYIDDIVIFSQTMEEHEKHLRMVLERLRSAKLYCSIKKSKLFRRQIHFLGHDISADGICPDEEKVEKITKWATPSTSKQLLKFLGTVQWMKKFINGLSHYVGTLTPLTSTTLKNKPFKWGQAEEDAFNNIKRLITTLPVLRNLDYDSDEPIWLFTDASGHGLGAALFQGAEWDTASPVAYESRTMNAAERNYPVHEQELLAVINALNKWRLLLLGMRVNVMSDHHSLTTLLSQRNLSRRQARWLETLSQFDLDFRYLKGEDNTVADALSRRDEVAACEVHATLNDEELIDIREGYELDAFCVKLRKVLPLRDDCIEKDGLLYLDGRLVIPHHGNLCQDFTTQAHEALGHLGTVKTLARLRHTFFWPSMSKDVETQLKTCDSCQRNIARTTKTPGKLQSNPIPYQPMQSIAIDFIGPFPKVSGYDMILTCTCRLTGFVRLIPASQKDTAEKSASRLFGAWSAIFGLPESIIGDRDKAWTSRFWQRLHCLLGVRINLSTAYHPQADGRSERSNKTVGQILRHRAAEKHGKWLESLPAAEFAINSAVNSATGVSPFHFVYGRIPRLFPVELPSEEEDEDVTQWIQRRQSEWAAWRDRLWCSRVDQAVQYNLRRRGGESFKEGSWVMVDSTDRQQVVGGKSKGVSKLRAQFDGPYQVLESLNGGRNFRLRLGNNDMSFPVFHISKLKAYHGEVEDLEVRE